MNSKERDKITDAIINLQITLEEIDETKDIVPNIYIQALQYLELLKITNMNPNQTIAPFNLNTI